MTFIRETGFNNLADVLLGIQPIIIEIATALTTYIDAKVEKSVSECEYLHDKDLVCILASCSY